MAKIKWCKLDLWTVSIAQGVYNKSRFLYKYRHNNSQPDTDMPISLIDFQGILDNVIPYDANSPFGLGEGPHKSAVSNDYYYYEQKQDVLQKWATEYACTIDEEYPTPMDEINGFTCNLWSDCLA